MGSTQRLKKAKEVAQTVSHQTTSIKARLNSLSASELQESEKQTAGPRGDCPRARAIVRGQQPHR